jgi:hypothetical protein
MKNPYVNEEGYDTAYYLFHELYRCRIPFVQMRSVEELRLYGIPSVGDPVLDKHMANELQTIDICIDKIYEYWKGGADIRIANVSDTKLIYERISNHLNDWKHYISSRLNQGTAPIEDLIGLDRFANVIYEHAKFHMTDDFLEFNFNKIFSDRHRSATSMVADIAAGVFARQAPTPGLSHQQTEDEIHAQYPRRTSMAESFASRLTLSSLNSAARAQSQAATDEATVAAGSVKSFADFLFQNEEG